MKRRVIHVVLLLVAGAIVNVAVAWVLTWISQMEPAGRIELPSAADIALWNVWRHPESGQSPAFASAFTATGVKVEQVSGVRSPNVYSVEYRSDGTKSIGDKYFDPNSVFGDVVRRYSAGWPFLSCVAVQCEPRAQPNRVPSGNFMVFVDPSTGLFLDDHWIGKAPTAERQSVGAIAVQSTRGRTTYYFALPYLPIWPGFAINTIFYAAILWVLFAVPLALRRRRRMQRGLCPACAYPVGTSKVCTECGAAVKAVGTTDATPGGE